MSVPLSNEQQQLVNALEDTYNLLQKAQTNLKKCSKQRLTRGYIEARLQSIEGYWQSFKTTHQELVKCTPKCKRNEIPYFLNEDFFVVEDLYTCTVGDLRDMLSSPSQLSQPTASMKHNESIVKLPRIEIPKFTGSYEDWPTFRDLFTSLVHNSSLSKVEKLHYLKTSVVGEPAELLKHVYVLESNYEQAWNILNHRYGNKRLIVNSLLHKLFNLKKLTSPSANHLKNLLDTTTQCLNNLKNQDIPTDSWDQIIIYLVVQKLDTDTHKDWEEYSFREDTNRLPTWVELRTFLETKFRSLEMVNPTTIKAKSFHVTTSEDNDFASPPRTCYMCKADHNLCHCKEFCSLQPSERCEFIKKNRLCYNCMMMGHSVIRCRVPTSCKICHRRHHTLLHTSDGAAENVELHHSLIEEEEAEPKSEKPEESDIAISTHFASGKSTSLLPTALVIVKDDEGHKTILRALVDQGSQANFITERAAQLLKIKRTQAKGTITGVGNTQTTVNHMAQLEILSKYEEEFKLSINAYIMPTRLTTQLPSKPITSTVYTSHIQGITLADPSFNTPGRIDMLLGVEVYAQILKADILNGPPGSPCAQYTSLGWILFGDIHEETSQEQILVTHHEFKVDDMRDGDTDITRMYTKDKEDCGNIYKETRNRNEDGRYRTENPKSKRLLQLERCSKKDKKLKVKYTQTMNEYGEKRHNIERNPKDERNNPGFYLVIFYFIFYLLIHHPVFKYDIETTQTSSIFDTSYIGTKYNVTLNIELRLKNVEYVSDIQKINRQILQPTTKEDKDFQRILWHPNNQYPVKEHRIVMVTFSTACAPYLAVKTLHQIPSDEKQINLGDDMLKFHIKLPPVLFIITKRKILSDIQTRFTPLGYLAPSLVPAKLIIQKVWLRDLQWEEEPEPEIKNKWLEVRESLNGVTHTKANRLLDTLQKTLKEVTILEYCDATMKAEEAVLLFKSLKQISEAMRIYMTQIFQLYDRIVRATRRP
ncbi:uncharacterized protein LOC123872610 [Maniola jurtina]|uniref:uncharacterized protein LOC123872610 n=1 Tax=Maniola jurtina TaxID=191418 RepID=UPI001E68DA7D|nr:uncharacterized protein LOC123872610 [Maniola jurtina]